MRGTVASWATLGASANAGGGTTPRTAHDIAYAHRHALFPGTRRADPSSWRWVAGTPTNRLGITLDWPSDRTLGRDHWARRSHQTDARPIPCSMLRCDVTDARKI